jgi:hypothetical protein
MFGRRPEEKVCPLVKGACLRDGCTFWTHIRGKHPQSGAEIDMPDCAIRYLPVLLIEGAKESRETAAAVESFRNEMVNQGDRALLAGTAIAVAKLKAG